MTAGPCFLKPARRILHRHNDADAPSLNRGVNDVEKLNEQLTRNNVQLMSQAQSIRICKNVTLNPVHLKPYT